MRTISQRELRNDSGSIMRQVQQGASFQVTSRGKLVATLSPASDDALADVTFRNGTGLQSFPHRRTATESSADVLAELRGDR